MNKIEEMTLHLFCSLFSVRSGRTNALNDFVTGYGGLTKRQLLNIMHVCRDRAILLIEVCEKPYSTREPKEETPK